MADTGFRGSPKIQKGALVQLAQDVVGVTPNIIVFQFNPTTLERKLQPFVPPEVDQTGKGERAPDVQPFDPEEMISVEIELDATEGMEDDDPVANTVGVADRLAALEKLIFPDAGALDDLVQSPGALSGLGTLTEQANRQTVPITLFVWGPGRIVPVRITSFSVTETLHNPQLRPIQATVSLELKVLTPDDFGGEAEMGPRSVTVGIAKAAYQTFRQQQNALADANVAGDVDQIRGLLPF